MSAPTPEQIQYMEAHISDDRRPGLIASIAIPLSIATIVVFLRFIARRRVRAPLLVDDWCILASLIITVGYEIASISTIHNGVGRHTILVTKPEALVKSVISSQILYCVALAPIKISILLLLHRIFPSRRVYAASMVIGGTVICYSIAQAVSLGLQCIPLSSLWTDKPGRCFSTYPLFTTTAIFNIITDVAILALPIPSLWRLQVSSATKIQLFGTFALGGLTIIFAIVRSTVPANRLNWDPSWGNVNVAIWSNIEIPTGIVSACLPCLRPLSPKRTQNSKKSSSKGSWKIHPIRIPNDSEKVETPEKPKPSLRMGEFTRILEDDDNDRISPMRTEESLLVAQKSQHSFV